MNRVVVNTLQPISIFITDITGKAKSGLSITYTIYKTLDNSIIDSGNLTDVGNGFYKEFFTFTELGHFYVIYTTPTSYQDALEDFEVVVEPAREEDLLRLLGLSGENMKIVDPVYTGFGKLSEATLKIYPSAADYQAGTNVLATYKVTFTYNVDQQLIIYGKEKL